MKIQLIIIFLLALSLSYSQVLESNWVNIADTDTHKIFVDTTSLKNVSDNITVIYMEYFPVSHKINGVDVIYLKTQTLFDVAAGRGTIIGRLYYDKQMKLITDNNLRSLLPSDIISIVIDSNEVMKKVYEYCLDRLGITPAKVKKKAARLFTDENVLPPIAPFESDSQEVIEEKPKEVSSSIKENKISKYIFEADGKYVIQVSAWRSKTKAENVASDLKRDGHNAFVLKVDIPGKGTWYRVRIGNFESVQEAEDYIRKNPNIF
ncbi:SPOR domain-containing protein [Melioribacter sp. OK-6-Me]|uniref:SPOR domain-containing protein n=1 Tax=unclassified Melioribacter TaxID=2627329 RepID=UPI003EDA0219